MSGISDCVFCHISGKFGGAKSLKGALLMIIKTYKKVNFFEWV